MLKQPTLRSRGVRSRRMTAAALCGVLFTASAGACRSESAMTPPSSAPAKQLTPFATDRKDSVKQTVRRVLVTGRRKIKFTNKGDSASGPAGIAILRARLRLAIASGNASGWTTRVRNSDGGDAIIRPEQLLEFLDRYQENAGAQQLIHPAAFQGDTGIVNLNVMSQSPASPTGFDFYTTSIASTTNPATKYLQTVVHNATRRVLLPNGAEVYRASGSNTGTLNQSATYDVHTTVWGGVTVGSGCGYDGVIGSDHTLNYQHWFQFIPPMASQLQMVKASAGSDVLRRACNEQPCDDMTYCDLDGDGEIDEPGPAGVGGEVEFDRFFDPPDPVGGGKLVCMVTDWYDTTGHYTDTTIDYCWIE